ncbi:MAG: hypothetical protein J0L52_04010 [Caulobacterales bacterium]|nr:hypothetical protein [Caulobacterales bacterium]
MRGTLLGIAVAALALTAGCGNRDERTYRDPETGSEITVQTGERMQAPRNMPAYAPIYPGARIENVMEGTSSGEGGADSGGMVTFLTDADMETVTRFYRERLNASGLTERSDVSMGSAMMLSATSAENASNAVQVTLSPYEAGSGTRVSVTYSQGS